MNSKIGDVDSKFRFIILAAKRTRQLQSGARPLITSASKKYTRMAMEEVRKNLVEYDLVAVDLTAKKSRNKE